MERKNEGNMPIRLSTVALKNGTTYFIDFRLNQLRNVKNPHDYMDFRNEFDMQDYIDENRKQSDRKEQPEQGDIFEKIKQKLINDGWTEQGVGTTYFNGEYATSFIKKDESETVHLFHNTFPDEELINQLKEKRDDIVIKSCPKCKKVLFEGSELDAKGMVIYCTDCLPKELKN